jgi:hypothetical protein
MRGIGILAAAVACTVATSAFGRIVVGEAQFEGTDNTNDKIVQWGYSYGNGGNPAWAQTLMPGQGKDGSQARRYTVDSSTVTQDTWGTWWGAGVGAWSDALYVPHTGTLSDYTVSADVKMVGTYDGISHTNTWLNIQFCTADDVLPNGTPNPTPDADAKADVWGEFKVKLTNQPENVWTTRSFGLNQFTSVTWNDDNNNNTPEVDKYTWDDTITLLSSGTLSGVSISVNVVDGNSRIAWDNNPPTFNNNGGYGLDNNNELWTDNFRIDVAGAVPEPTALGTVLVAGTLLMRRKRNK